MAESTGTTIIGAIFVFCNNFASTMQNSIFLDFEGMPFMSAEYKYCKYSFPYKILKHLYDHKLCFLCVY